MNDINKQKFLAELGKLLTFMYEEDRLTALAMYGKMFDDTDDEQGLIQFLGSPTRQAVVVARTYNARVRKLQVESQSRREAGTAPEAVPDFVLAIDKLYQEYIPEHSEKNRILDDQFSLFEDAPLPAEDAASESGPAAGGFPLPVAPAETESAVAETVEMLERGADGGAVALAVEQVFDDAVGTQDEVDSFLEDFSISEETLAEDAVSGSGAALPPEGEEGEEESYLQAEPVILRKPRILLMILYVLLAVPITLLCVVLLLIPTLLCLGLAAVFVTAGAALLVAAFSGFKILADFLLLFGGAIVLLALGLLSLWLFVWFIGGAIAGVIRGVIQLGGRWCYKEVAV